MRQPPLLREAVHPTSVLELPKNEVEGESCHYFAPHWVEYAYAQAFSHRVFTPRADVLQVEVAAGQVVDAAPGGADDVQRLLQPLYVIGACVSVQRHADETKVQVPGLPLDIVRTNVLVGHHPGSGVKGGEQNHARGANFAEPATRS